MGVGGGGGGTSKPNEVVIGATCRESSWLDRINRTGPTKMGGAVLLVFLQNLPSQQIHTYIAMKLENRAELLSCLKSRICSRFSEPGQSAAFSPWFHSTRTKYGVPNCGVKYGVHRVPNFIQQGYSLFLELHIFASHGHSSRFAELPGSDGIA